MAVGGQTFWCHLVVICLYFKTYSSVLLFVSPSSLAGGMRTSQEFYSELSQIEEIFHLPFGDYAYASNGEVLKILVFSDRTERRKKTHSSINDCLLF